MEMDKVLAAIGLNDKEAKVYLAILQLGTASVPRISERAGTKRPTTYLILEDLRKKRLVTKVMRGSVIIYTAESPEKLLAEEEKKTDLIRSTLPDFLAIYNTKKEKPRIRFFQGEKGVRELYEQILEEKQIIMYGSIGAIEEKIPGLTTQIISAVHKKKISVKELLQADHAAIEYVKTFPATELHQIKLAPTSVALPTDNMIFGNKLAIFSYKDEPMVVVIESSDVIITYKSMFEMLWNTI